LHYADDTVVFAESSAQLQRVLNAMFEYCRMWDLKINSNKTKVVVFWKTKRCLRNLPHFYFEQTI